MSHGTQYHGKIKARQKPGWISRNGKNTNRSNGGGKKQGKKQKKSNNGG